MNNTARLGADGKTMICGHPLKHGKVCTFQTGHEKDFSGHSARWMKWLQPKPEARIVRVSIPAETQPSTDDPFKGF